MRTLHWLFLVSVALFISGIGFVIAGARASRQADPAEEGAVTTPVASIAQIMNGIVQPNATVVYNAVGTFVSVQGVKEVAPQTDEEWAAIGNSAAALVESGNLLLLGSRVVDTGDWIKMTRAYMDASQRALTAAQAKDKDGILTAGSDLNDTCDSCHAKYQRQ
ncbi:MAG: cytochrome c [Acidobacteria bacterium]|nr:cytochrome c [Acidobacteriota bacterium]